MRGQFASDPKPQNRSHRKRSRLAAGMSQSSGRAGIWCRADTGGIFFATRACHRSVTGQFRSEPLHLGPGLLNAKLKDFHSGMRDEARISNDMMNEWRGQWELPSVSPVIGFGQHMNAACMGGIFLQ